MKKNDKHKSEKIDTEAADVKKSGEPMELENLENQLKRALADYQNLEKRINAQKSEWIKMSNKDLILRLLPGLDSLILAERNTQDEGVKLSIKHFMDILGSVGVRQIDTFGKDFDPKTMEAIETREGEEGKVLEEVRTGYMLYDQVLRPAQVLVGSAKQNMTN